jgi:hypothetical protein
MYLFIFLLVDFTTLPHCLKNLTPLFLVLLFLFCPFNLLLLLLLLCCLFRLR